MTKMTTTAGASSIISSFPELKEEDGEEGDAANDAVFDATDDAGEDGEYGAF